LISWSLYERFTVGKPTAVGAASGAVSGLVAITPSCAYLHPVWALVLGLIVGTVCALAVELKWKLGFDDSLDVVGIHLVGGIVGTLFIGLAGEKVGIWSFSVAWLSAMLVQKTFGFRVKSTDEIAGVDRVIHGETAYSETDPRWTWRG
jgi:Amt family ammonium transporter